jgi:hypothetical protein
MFFKRRRGVRRPQHAIPVHWGLPGNPQPLVVKIVKKTLVN